MPVSPTPLQALLQHLHLLPTPLLDAFAAPLFGRALCIAVRRGVFEALAEGPSTPETVAARCGLESAATRLLLDSCAACGYLTTTGSRYRIASPARRWLVRSSPHYLGNLLAYIETRYARWVNLEATLEQGRTDTPYQAELSDDEWDLYTAGMADFARFLMPYVLRRLTVPANARRGLDLGGSHGLYAAALCRRHPGLSMTVLDDPRAVRRGPQFVAGEPGGGGVSYRAADLLRDPLPGGQDILLMFNLIHGFTAEENASLMRRARDAMNPGGRLFILDQFREQRAGGGVARFIPLMMGLHLLNESCGGTYAAGEVAAWCSGARRVRRFRLGLPGVGLLEVEV